MQPHMYVVYETKNMMWESSQSMAITSMFSARSFSASPTEASNSKKDGN